MIDVLNAICSNIATRFKNSPIYIDTMPQDFKRPSFYIELVNSKDTDLNSEAQRREMTFQIIYFGRKDNFNNVSTLDQYATWSVLEKIFYRVLEVDKDKRDYKKIVSNELFIKDDLLYMTLRLDFGYIIEDNILDPGEIYELMQELNLKYNLK